VVKFTQKRHFRLQAISNFFIGERSANKESVQAKGKFQKFIYAMRSPLLVFGQNAPFFVVKREYQLLPILSRLEKFLFILLFYIVEGNSWPKQLTECDES